MAHDRPARQDRRGNARELEGVAADCLLPIDVMMQSPNGRLGKYDFICTICPLHSASWVRARSAPPFPSIAVSGARGELAAVRPRWQCRVLPPSHAAVSASGREREGEREREREREKKRQMQYIIYTCTYI
jgi:hypothetical protein